MIAMMLSSDDGDCFLRSVFLLNVVIWAHAEGTR
jgi:hypothetical protein